MQKCSIIHTVKKNEEAKTLFDPEILEKGCMCRERYFCIQYNSISILDSTVPPSSCLDPSFELSQKLEHISTPLFYPLVVRHRCQAIVLFPKY